MSCYTSQALVKLNHYFTDYLSEDDPLEGNRLIGAINRVVAEHLRGGSVDMTEYRAFLGDWMPILEEKALQFQHHEQVHKIHNLVRGISSAPHS